MGRERLKKPKHPTQKPVRVLEHLLKLGSKEDDLVFDPFMGVGSSGVAAFICGVDSSASITRRRMSKPRDSDSRTCAE
jgi:hypothetical protein